jgi:hypothetical protein
MKQVLASKLMEMLQEAIDRWGDLPVNVVTESEVERVSYIEQDFFDEDQGKCLNIVGQEEEE